jgi:putative Mn2+ efflux pump MntP
MWDLRTPSGCFFGLLGLILCAVGVFAPDLRAPLTEANVNLYTGIVMLLFGVVLLWLARRAA